MRMLKRWQVEFQSRLDKRCWYVIKVLASSKKIAIARAKRSFSVGDERLWRLKSVINGGSVVEDSEFSPPPASPVAR